MSSTANPQESPGGNYPDRRDDDSAPDEGALRSDAGVGGAVAATAEGSDPAVDDHPETSLGAQHSARSANAADPAPAPSTATQNAPAMDQHPTTDQERIDGILAQTRADLAGADEAEIARVLRQRFEQSGLDVDEARLAELTREV